MLTPDEVRALLAYDPETGVLTWRARADARPGWNTRYAGTAARTIMKGYVVVRIRRRLYSAHRLAWAITHGAWPPADIDHINGVRDDNRLTNLRAATRAENLANSRRRVDNTSGVKGVCFDKRKAAWRATISVNGKTVNLGRYRTKDEAAAAYKAHAVAHRGGFHRDA